MSVELPKPKRKSSRDTEFEAAFNRLPQVAPAQVEIDWISGHPAMYRKSRDPENCWITLSAEEIEGAPSKAAVNRLQFFVNNPKEFNKDVSTIKNKLVSDADVDQERERVMDLGLEEVERLLNEVRRQKRGLA